MKEHHRPSSTLPMRLVDIEEVARQLGVSRHTIYSWVAQRRIPYLKVGRLLRFDLDAIASWLNQNAHNDRP